MNQFPHRRFNTETEVVVTSDCDDVDYIRLDGPTLQGRLLPDEARRVAAELIEAADELDEHERQHARNQATSTPPKATSKPTRKASVKR